MPFYQRQCYLISGESECVCNVPSKHVKLLGTFGQFWSWRVNGRLIYKFKLFPQQTGTFWSGTKTSTNNHVIQLWWESNIVHKPVRSTNKPSGSGDLIYVLQYWTSLSRSQRSDFVFLSKWFFLLDIFLLYIQIDLLFINFIHSFILPFAGSNTDNQNEWQKALIFILSACLLI